MPHNDTGEGVERQDIHLFPKGAVLIAPAGKNAYNTACEAAAKYNSLTNATRIPASTSGFPGVVCTEHSQGKVSVYG